MKSSTHAGMPLEKTIQRKILDELSQRNIVCWRNSPLLFGRNKYVPRGMPDIFCLVGGILLGIEVKTKEGRVSKEQVAFGDKLVLAGASYCIATSWEDVDNHIRTL